MKKILAFFLLSVSITSSLPAASVEKDNSMRQEQSDKMNTDTKNQNSMQNSDMQDRPTMKNEVTSENQSSKDRDLNITKKIRKSLMADETLSTSAKNIKVITIDGMVTLRGEVDNDQERYKIEQKVKSISGVTQLSNQLQVKQSKK